MHSGFVCDTRLLDYNSGPGAHVFSKTNYQIEPYFHIDNSLSKKRLYNLIKNLKLLEKLSIIKVRPAEIDEISLIHEIEYINKIKSLSEVNGGDAGFGTPFSKDAFEIASLGIGGLIDLSEKIYLRELKNGFALMLMLSCFYKQHVMIQIFKALEALAFFLFLKKIRIICLLRYRHIIIHIIIWLCCFI